MKQNNFIHALLIGISAVYFSGCKSEPVTQDVSIVLDETEEYFTHISIEQFKEISALTENKSYGESVRIQPITEFGLNDIKSFKIDPVPNKLLGNDYTKKAELNNYYSEIEKTLTELHKGKHERTGSVIYKIMSEELNRLSDSKADRKVLIINSDLMEKSFVDFYSAVNFNQLRAQQEKMQSVLIEQYPLKKLNGIEIHIVYSPLDKSDNARFEIISGFYKNWFENLGARVFIQSNLRKA